MLDIDHITMLAQLLQEPECLEVPAASFVPEESYGAAGGTNTLFQGDNAEVLRWLATSGSSEGFGMEGLKLVYIDPPFLVGSDFSMRLSLGDQAYSARNTALSGKAYSDSWEGGDAAFFRMLLCRLRLIRRLLAKDGSIYVHCDWRTSATTRLLLDAVFGQESFLGEIIWHYTGGGRAKKYFSRKHDTIFHYAKSRSWIFNLDAVRVPYKPGSGYAKSGIVSRAGKTYLPHSSGTPVDDVWDIPIINPMAKERLGYPTQKPELLLERIILASSNPGDIVGDFFCGSGTTLAVAQRLGRRWIGVDSSLLGIATAKKRLLAGIENTTKTAGFTVWGRNTPPQQPPEYLEFFIQQQDNTVQIELVERASCQGRQQLPFLAEAGPDGMSMIDFWAVGIEGTGRGTITGQVEPAACYEGKHFFCLWHAQRTRNNRQLRQKSPLLTLPFEGAVVVQLMDVFGNTYWYKPNCCLHSNSN